MLGSCGEANRDEPSRPSWTRHELGAGDVVGEVLAVGERDDVALGRVQYQCRRLQGGERVPHVDIQ